MEGVPSLGREVTKHSLRVLSHGSHSKAAEYRKDAWGWSCDVKNKQITEDHCTPRPLSRWCHWRIQCSPENTNTWLECTDTLGKLPRYQAAQERVGCNAQQFGFIVVKPLGPKETASVGAYHLQRPVTTSTKSHFDWIFLCHEPRFYTSFSAIQTTGKKTKIKWKSKKAFISDLNLQIQNGGFSWALPLTFGI